MIVRCGRCGVQFQVPGAGRYACPSCGATNEVRAVPGGATPPGPPAAGPPGSLDLAGAAPSPPPPSEPAEPSPRRRCPTCDFTFIVGDIDVATCPNCGSEVPTGAAGS